MVLNTLRAIQAMPYPHTTYLCDEANDPYLQKVCAELGVRHIARSSRTDAKAGNINHALRKATGDICLIIDPDHVPAPDFLDHVLPYFEDDRVGFVQCAQAYYNHRESLVAYGAAEQTFTFYGPMMTCMGQYGTAQAIGANCTFRRAALDSIGGHAAGLSEDMHTAMLLHAQGWTSTYVPLPLSYGLVPATLAAYYKQQLKWARGTLELLVTTFPRVVGQLTGRQRLHYLTMPLYYLLGLVQFIDFMIPILSLIWMRLPLRLDLLLFATAYVPLLLTAFLIRQYAQRWLLEKHEAGFHILGGLLASGTWWVYVLGLLYTLFRVDVPYLPTPKNDKPRNHFVLLLPNLLMLMATLGAIGYSIYHYGRFATSNIYSQLMIGFGLLNAGIIGLNLIIGQERYLYALKQWIGQLTFEHPLIRPLRIAFWHIRYGFYGWIRLSALPLYLGLLMLTTGLVAYTSRRKTAHLPQALPYATTQSFYYGFDTTHIPAGGGIPPRQVLMAQHIPWQITPSATTLTRVTLPTAANEVPLLYIEPSVAGPGGHTAQAERVLNRFLQQLLQGQYDTSLATLTNQLSRYNRPVIVSFAPAFDDTLQSWGTERAATLALYTKAMRYLVDYGRQHQWNQVTWLWCPTQASTLVSYYPGGSYVHWIGLSIRPMQSGASDHSLGSFAAQYQALHNTIRLHAAYSIRQKPILLTQLGPPNLSDTDTVWFQDACSMINERYPEIRGAVLTPAQFLMAQKAGLR